MMNSANLRTLFALCLSLQVLSLAIPPQVGAEEQTHVNPTTKQLVFNEAFEPTDGERPNTRGGGARPAPNCPGSPGGIKSLMPQRNYGLTFEEHPSIFINLPETTAREVWLSFQDENGDFFETTILPIAQKSGIIRFAWPNDLPPLETGNTYKWTLAVVCGESLDPDDPLFTGYITRIDRTADIEQQLASKTAIEQAQWYAQEGYWYDLLLALALARQEQPENTNLKTLWESLLESVGLENIASQPLHAID